VRSLGERAPVPVEVVPFGWRTLLGRFERAGAQPRLRTRADGSEFLTDGGHLIVDCAFAGGIADAVAAERALRTPAGVVETGLFLGMASTVVVAGAAVRVLDRPAA
jgi:ribose 5-phosphate isomerase A